MPEETFKERLVGEYNDLTFRTEKLKEFSHGDNFSKIPKEQQDLLKVQFPIMQAYQQVLKQRLELLG